MDDRRQVYKTREWTPGDYSIRFVGFKSAEGDNFPQVNWREWGGEPNRPRLTYYTELENKDEGPLGSLDAHRDLRLFVDAVTGDSSFLPEGFEQDPNILDEALIQASNALVDSKAWFKVYVNARGWVNTVRAMDPSPEETVYLAFSRFTSLDDNGKPIHKERSNPKWKGTQFHGRLVIATGKRKGREIPFSMDYPFVVGGNGKAMWRFKEEGGKVLPTKATERFLRFLALFCGFKSAKEAEEQFDLDASGDPANVLPGVKVDTTAVVLGNVDDGGWVNMDSLSLPPEEARIAYSPDGPSGASLEELEQIMSKHACVDVRKGTQGWKWTDDGTKWASDVLVKMCEKHELERSVLSWSPVQRKLVMDDLVKEMGEVPGWGESEKGVF